MDPDRARGVLLGLALGDALGAPFEGWPGVPAPELAAWYEDPAPLRWTDDTHMALTLARWLVTDPTLDDPEGLGAAFAAAYAAEPWRGYGSGPPQVFALAAERGGYARAAASLFGGTGSFGNGAAMRVAPVGLVAGAAAAGGAPVAAGAAGDVADLATRQARLTHTHPDAIAGAVAVAQLVAALVRAPLAATVELADIVGSLSSTLPAGAVRDRIADVLTGSRGGEPLTVTIARVGTGLAAAEAVPAAVAALLHGRDLMSTLTAAIRLGGDTDTIAAMAGAMAGAAWGLAGLPGALLDRLEARRELEQLAAELVGA